VRGKASPKTWQSNEVQGRPGKLTKKIRILRGQKVESPIRETRVRKSGRVRTSPNRGRNTSTDLASGLMGLLQLGTTERNRVIIKTVNTGDALKNDYWKNGRTQEPGTLRALTKRKPLTSSEPRRVGVQKKKEKHLGSKASGAIKASLGV